MKRRTMAYVLLGALLLGALIFLGMGVVAIWAKSPAAAIAVVLVGPAGIGLALLISYLLHVEDERQA